MRYKITATKKQLESIGVNRNLVDTEVKKLKYYNSTGYVQVEAPAPRLIIEVFGAEAKPERYDIPSVWLKEISTI